MKVEVQYTAECPHARSVMRRLKELADQRADVVLDLTLVELGTSTPLGFTGSPTVLIDGENRFGGTPIDSPACALHPPTADQVVAAISDN